MHKNWNKQYNIGLKLNVESSFSITFFPTPYLSAPKSNEKTPEYIICSGITGIYFLLPEIPELIVPKNKTQFENENS